jgi:FkbM family methyltransferase
MQRIFYAIFYQPQVNFLVRNLVRTVNDVFRTDMRHSVSGKIRLQLGGGKSFQLALNESSAAHIYFWERAIHYEFTPIFIKLAARAKVFFDVGANIGFYTAVANAVNPDIKVWAFEPADGPNHYLLRNKALNGWKNTTISKTALSDKEGQVTFFEGKRPKYKYLKYHLSGIGAMENTHNNPDMISYTVATETLDHFVQANKVPTIDIMKMDTEATEHYILSKGYETLLRDKPIIICEVLFGKVEGEIERHMKALGMHFFEQIGKDLIPTETLSKFKDNQERSFFFVPTEKLDWVKEFVVKG